MNEWIHDKKSWPILVAVWLWRADVIALLNEEQRDGNIIPCFICAL